MNLFKLKRDKDLAKEEKFKKAKGGWSYGTRTAPGPAARADSDELESPLPYCSKERGRA
jgi:hypothetical protein